MNITSLMVQLDGVTRKFRLNNKTLLFSEKNSVGKSTLLRLLFFGLGYPIPATAGIDFKKVNVKVGFERSGNKYLVDRTKNYIQIFRDGEFLASQTLTGQDDEWLAYIWGIDSLRVLKNILGAIYMDQDKGWTLLNRGKVIGNIRFNVRDLLLGLSKNENRLDDELNQLDEQKTVLNKTRQLIALNKSVDSYRENGAVNVSEPVDTVLMDKLKNLQLKQKVIRNSLREIKRSINNEEGLVEYLVTLKLMIETPSGPIAIDKKNLLNFEDNIDYLRKRSAIMQEDMERVKADISEIQGKLRESASNLFSEVNVVDKTLFEISKLNIDSRVLEAREDELTQSNSELNEMIEKKFTDSNDLISEAQGWINLFATQLGVFDVVKDKKYIFTRDLKSISGTIYYKVVFSFKMAYIKTIEAHTGIVLPIILDSPSGREVTQGNISEVIGILNDYFEANQVIIASIHKYELSGVKELEIVNKIFE